MTVKLRLLEAIADKNRGLLANSSDQKLILDQIAQVEATNPTPHPTRSPAALAGDWRLLFTTSRELLGIDRVPLFNLGSVWQCIRPEQQRVINIAEVQGIPGFESLVSVAAQFAVVNDTRLEVVFERLVLGLRRPLGYQQPSQWVERLANSQRCLGVDVRLQPRRRPGWIDVTYLDTDLRISRGNQNSVFVLTREAS
jgi:hypothetical protein